MTHPLTHIPVLRAEMLHALSPRDGDVIADGTFGLGGYTQAILDHAATRVVALDRDPDAIARASAIRARYGGRLALVRERFSRLRDALDALGHDRIQGIVLDIGVSSPQIDDAQRGFSFRFDGPLDMRMDPENGPSAADLVNACSETDLADLIYRYGEERASRRIARAIVQARSHERITRTAQLADLVARTIPAKRGDPQHPATRTFQALRIAVNDELGELSAALACSASCLAAGGRLVVVTFHSLEDRIVKNFLHGASRQPAQGTRYAPANDIAFEVTYRVLTPKPIVATATECAANPRARSAKLRAAVRLGTGGAS